jgi:hypothetical protein
MWHSIAAHGPAARTLAVHSLAVLGWLWAIVNWVRIRHLQRIQEELLLRLFNPPRTRYAPGIGAFLAIGLAVEGADLVAWRMKSWVIVRFGVELVVSKYSIPSKVEWVTVAPASDLARTFAARAGAIMAQCV